MDAFEELLRDYGCYEDDQDVMEKMDEVDVYLYLTEYVANEVYNDFDDTLTDWICQAGEETDVSDVEDYLDKYNIALSLEDYIYQYLEEYGDINFRDGRHLKACSLQFAFETLMRDAYYEEWKPKLEEALGKRFDKLKALWRKKKAVEVLKKTDVFIMSDEIGKFL